MDFNQHYIKNGILAGVICSLIYFTSHTFDPGFYIKQAKIFSGLTLILFLVKTCKDERAALGGYASFGELLKATFIMYMIAAFIISIFIYILYNFINPDLAALELEIMGEAITKALEWFSIPEDDIEEALIAIDEVDYQKDFFTVLTDFISKLFSGIILSLIVSAIYKKNRVA